MTHPSSVSVAPMTISTSPDERMNMLSPSSPSRITTWPGSTSLASKAPTSCAQHDSANNMSCKRSLVRGQISKNKKKKSISEAIGKQSVPTEDRDASSLVRQSSSINHRPSIIVIVGHCRSLSSSSSSKTNEKQSRSEFFFFLKPNQARQVKKATLPG
jgi:hypothetical protein